MSVLNKVCICLFCSQVSCCMASCYDEWSAAEACGLGYLNCAGCAWTVFAPVCHQCTLGDCGKGTEQLAKGAKFCLYGFLLSIISPIDGFINCILYQKKNFQSGVSGSSDMLQNCQFVGKKISEAFDVKGSNEPGNTFRSYTP